MTELLLNHGADVNKMGVKSSATSPFNHVKEYYTPIYAAAYQGHNEVVKLLLDNNADIYLPSGAGMTPLHVAAQYGHLKVVQCIVEAKIETDDKVKLLDTLSAKNMTALGLAVATHSEEVAAYLIDRGASIEVVGQAKSPTKIAEQADDVSMLSILKGGKSVHFALHQTLGEIDKQGEEKELGTYVPKGPCRPGSN